jgi:flagellum-specific peptidoglycan hydrolase FlgJ
MSAQPPPDIIAAAQLAAERWGIPASVLLAQWALESGWGAHMPGGSNNPFGEKASPGDRSVEELTDEVIDGQKVTLKQPFRAFLSINDAFDFHAEHLATSHWYIPARACLPDVAKFCEALGGGTPQHPSYSTSPTYGATLMRIINGSNLERYDA